MCRLRRRDHGLTRRRSGGRRVHSVIGATHDVELRDGADAGHSAGCDALGADSASSFAHAGGGEPHCDAASASADSSGGSAGGRPCSGAGRASVASRASDVVCDTGDRASRVHSTTARISVRSARAWRQSRARAFRAASPSSAAFIRAASSGGRARDADTVIRTGTGGALDAAETGGSATLRDATETGAVTGGSDAASTALDTVHRSRASGATNRAPAPDGATGNAGPARRGTETDSASGFGERCSTDQSVPCQRSECKSAASRARSRFRPDIVFPREKSGRPSAGNLEAAFEGGNQEELRRIRPTDRQGFRRDHHALPGRSE